MVNLLYKNGNLIYINDLNLANESFVLILKVIYSAYWRNWNLYWCLPFYE